MSYLHSVPKSIGYAVSGLKTAFKNEPNFRVHALAAIAVVILGLLTRLNTLEWMIVAATIASVVVLELVNTSIEAIVNMVSPNVSDGARIAKDTAAAAVLVCSAAAAIIGLCLFVPKFL